MIKEKVKKALKVGEIERIELENQKLTKKIDVAFDEINLAKEQICENINFLCDLALRNREYLSREYLLLKDKPSILVCGFYGARNFGDELMLQSILRYFDKKNTKVTILLSDNYDLDASIYSPHDVIHYPKCSSDILALADNFKTVIWGGGAHLDDFRYGFNNGKPCISYILNMISKAVIKKGGNVVVLGVSSNEKLDNSRYLKDLQYVVDGSKYFSLRDANSLETLKSAGIDVGSIKVIDDIALCSLPNQKDRKIDNHDGMFTVGLVCILTEQTREKLSEYIVGIVRHLENKYKKIRIKLIPFYDYYDNDKIEYKRIVNSCASVGGVIEIEDYMDEMDDLIKVMGRCDLIISMRYHATLVASNLGIKTISLDYSGMHRHYRNKIGYIKERYNEGLLNCEFGSNTQILLERINEALKQKDNINYSKRVEEIKRVLNDELDAALSNLE